MGRAKSEFVVLMVTGAGIFERIARNLHSTDEARKWLKENGKEKEQYHIAAFYPGPIRVKIEKTYRRKLIAGVIPAVTSKPAKEPKKD